MIRRLVVIAATAALLFVAAVFASPWLAAQQMRDAARAQNVAALSRHIDFPALRANLKAHLAESLAQRRDAPAQGNDLAAMLLAALIDPMVEALITPESLAGMMAAGEQPSVSAPDGTATNAPEDATRPATEIRTGYEGIDRFAMAVRLADSGREPVVFVLHRQGLFAWKLASMRIAMPAQPAPATSPGLP